MGDYLGGLPRDAEFEACHSTPYLCGSSLGDARVELTGPAAVIPESE